MHGDMTGEDPISNAVNPQAVLSADEVSLRFEGIDNFRDFGAGAGVAGRYFRSAQLSGATPADVERLQSLGLKTIIDLRRPAERKQKSSPSQLAPLVIANDDGDRAEAPHVEFLRQGDTSDAAVDRFLLDYYRKAPFEPRHLWLFAQAFAAKDRGPVLVHCTAGKDRTGLLAALILVAAGASLDDIMVDFMKTNDVMLREPHIGRARAMSFQLLGRDPGQKIIM
ncbi:MAG TPA: tyrosine-protein phosphatase, partial [Rhizomicrobium sp.]|nr:tyrosine-protein phosphatase [Rhizomicrobium sp.]